MRMLGYASNGRKPAARPSKLQDDLAMEWRSFASLLPYELDGKVDLAFAAEGVRCRFDIPLSQLTDGARMATTFNGAGSVQTIG